MDAEDSPDDVGYLSTDAVAHRLDVKLATVYAYVSRGVLTSVRLPGRKGSWFAEPAVEQLARRGRETKGARDPLNRVSTHLTLLKDDDLYYRGHRVTDLARSWDLESVAGLLWEDELGERAAFTVSAAQLDAVRKMSDALPASAGLTDRLRAAVTALSATDVFRSDLSQRAVTRAGSTMIAAMVVTLGGQHAIDEDAMPVAERLWPALTESPSEPGLLNAALVLLADHDLAISTVAARVAASARAHPYAVVTAGLGALDGPYHGAASVITYRFLAEAVHDPIGVASQRLRDEQRVPGFGHAVYREVDPRAQLLLSMLRDTPRAEPFIAAVDRIAEELSSRSAAVVNIDLALAVLMHAFDMRPDAGEAIFALARTVGWIGHALEEYTQPALRFRPNGLYVGDAPRE